MWIEKITFYGFGGITNEQIAFGPDDINLIVEPNEYGKSTLAEVIWATLFDFPEHGTKAALAERENFKPWDRKAPYKAEIDLSIDGKSLKVIRNFAKKEVQVIDRNTNFDVTAEWVGKDKAAGKPDATDQVGFLMTGMTRDLFRSTCLLGQRHLDAHHITSSNDIAPMFQAMADTATPSSTSGGAIDALNEALLNYSFSGTSKRVSVEDAINELESTRADMLQKLAQMEIEHRKTAEQVTELAALNKIGEVEETVVDVNLSAEFDLVRMDLQEAEKRLEFLKQRYEQKLLLEDDLKNLDLNTSASSPTISTLESLWKRKVARQAEADKLTSEIQPQVDEYERLDRQHKECYQTVPNLTADEANSVSALAVNMYKLQQELNQLQREHQEQTGRHLQRLLQSSQQHGTALDVLKSLSRSEIEEAKNYSSLLIMFYDQVQEEQKKIQETKFSLDDIEERRKTNRTHNIGKMIGCFVVASASVVVAYLNATPDVKNVSMLVYGAIVLMLITMVAGIVFMGMVINYAYYLKEDGLAAEEAEQKHHKALTGLKTKIQNLEAKLTSIAIKTGSKNKDDLIKFINEASSHDEVVSEQEVRDTSLGNQEAKLSKLQKDLAYFFEKAGRDSSQIDSQQAMDLSQEVTQFHKDKEALETTKENIKSMSAQLDSLNNEIEDIGRELEALMVRSGLPVDLDHIEEQIHELLKVSTDRQALLNEIARVEFDFADYEGPLEAIRDLQYDRDLLKEKLDGLIEQAPALASRADSAQKGGSAQGSAASDKPSSAEVSARKEELIVQIRTALNYRDEHFLETIEGLAIIEHELNCARRAKHALCLARDVIKQISSETYEDWSQQLNSEAERLISQLNLDIEKLSFDHSLRLNVKLKGHDRVFSSLEIVSRLSTGTREQIHWLARIILTTFLSKKQPLPIVLDEPFSEADDVRFVSMMKFLIASIAPHNQIIILSCHRQRHQWLASQLNLAEKEKLAFRTRKQLGAGAPGAVR